MNFIANPDADINFTSFHGVTLELSYPTMVKLLGQPHYRDGDKTQYEWFFTGEDGNSVTVYDWKSYAEFPNVWNVGGLSKEITQQFKNWVLKQHSAR